MDYSREIIKKINSMSDSQSPYRTFCDFVTCTALSIVQNVVSFSKREKQFKDIIEKYDVKKFTELMSLLTYTYEDHFGDILGNIYMMSGWGNKNAGQFFTPYSVSQCCAESVNYKPDEIIFMNEPSAGAGGMIVATAEAMKNQGINFQKSLRVVAQDLDQIATYMCYITLSLYGIDAKVIQGDTLENQICKNLDDKVYLTPMFWMNGAMW